MKIEQLQRWHVEAIEKQGAVDATIVLANERMMRSLLEDGPSFAGTTDEGVVAIMGMAEYSKDVYRCWAITDPTLARKHFFAICKNMRRFLSEHPYPRVETLVLKGNIPGHRWIRHILGFEFEGVLRNFNPPQDAVMYSRIQR